MRANCLMPIGVVEKMVKTSFPFRVWQLNDRIHILNVSIQQGFVIFNRIYYTQKEKSIIAGILLHRLVLFDILCVGII